MEVFFQYLSVSGPFMVAGVALVLHRIFVGRKKSDERDQIDVLPDPDGYLSFKAWASQSRAHREK